MAEKTKGKKTKEGFWLTAYDRKQRNQNRHEEEEETNMARIKTTILGQWAK